jgi:Na+/proline symporter
MDIMLLSLLLYVALAFVSVYGINAMYRNNKLGFFVSNREAPWWQVGFSAAAGFMYMFSIVMTAAFAATKGWVATTWFVLAYITVITFYGYVGRQLLTKFPNGFTFSEYIKNRYESPGLTKFYQILHLFAAVYMITANMTGFGMIAEYLSKDFSYNILITVIAITALSYSLWGGIKASLRTDTIQMLLILFVSVIFGTYAVFSAGGLGTVLQNWTAAKPGNFFDPAVMLDPGLLLFLLFIGGITADNGHFQKQFSVGDPNKIVKAYFFAALVLLVAHIGLVLLAASSFSLGFGLLDPKLAGVQTIDFTLGYWGLVIFGLAILAKCSSSIDTAFNSAGSIVANDLFPNKNPILASRLGMVAVMLVAYAIALLKIDLMILIATFGVFRLLAVAPTMYALFVDNKIKMQPVFYTMLATGAVGLVIIINKIPVDKITMSLVALVLPAMVILFQHNKVKKQELLEQ